MQSKMRLFFSQQYLASEYQFDTTRKAGWIADSLSSIPIQGVELAEPVPLTVEEITTVHDVTYIEAVRTGEPTHLAQSQGFDWGLGLFPAVSASNGGMVAAALEALQTGVSSCRKGPWERLLHFQRSGNRRTQGFGGWGKIRFNPGPRCSLRWRNSLAD